MRGDEARGEGEGGSPAESGDEERREGGRGRGQDSGRRRPDAFRLDDENRGRDTGPSRRSEGDEDEENEIEDNGDDESAVSGGALAEINEEDDPLSPAYDLDHGEPLEERGSSTRRSVANRAEVRSAKEFFNGEILYRFDILDDESRKELAGSYRVELKGYSGGIWTVNVADQIEVVNRREEADVVLTMQQRDFLQLVNGEINPQLAIVAQKLRLSGDVRKGVTAQILFSPLGE